MKISNFNKKIVKELRTKLNEAFSNGEVEKLASELGIEISAGNCSYTTTDATFKLKITMKDAPTREQIDLEEMVSHYELDYTPTQTRILNGDEVKLTGYFRGRRKWCWQVQNVHTGEMLLTTDKEILRLFKPDKPDPVLMEGFLLR